MADRNIGRISAVITARDVNFTSELTKAKNATASFGSSFASSASRVVSGAALIAAASTAVYVGISQVSQSLERLGGAADAAAKLGLQNMPEFLQGLQYSASLVGVQADSVTSSLSKLFRTIAEANAGSKSDRDILSALGLSASSLGGMTPDKVVLRVADALDKVADSGERARLAVALFGKSGGDMVNVLRGGSSAVSGGIREAQSLGVARTAGELAKADAAGDSLDRMRASIDGLWNELTVSISPAITSVANAITEYIKTLKGDAATNESRSKETVAVTAALADAGGALWTIGKAMGAYGSGRQAELLKLPASYGGDAIREEYKMAKIREEVTERERLRTVEKQKQLEILKQAEARELRMESMLNDRVSTTNAILTAEKERTKTARDQYWLDLESARLALIAEAESTSRSVAESLASQLLQEQDQLQSEAEARAQRINDMMRNPGGAPTIISGSAEEQLARFNAANASMQGVAERQLTIQQRIDKELTRIREKNEAVERLFQEVLNRFPVINPV